jgi:hypothetical protein
LEKAEKHENTTYPFWLLIAALKSDSISLEVEPLKHWYGCSMTRTSGNMVAKKFETELRPFRFSFAMLKASVFDVPG